MEICSLIRRYMRNGVVLPDSALKALTTGLSPEIKTDPCLVQPSSVDVMCRGLVRTLKSEPCISDGLSMEDVFGLTYEIRDLNRGPLILLAGQVYLIETDIEFNLSESLQGRFNPKSTAGRHALSCRALVEGSKGYDQIQFGYKGKAWIIVIPQGYSVILDKKTSLVQFRLFRGLRYFVPGEELLEIHKRYPLLGGKRKLQCNERGMLLHLDLSNKQEYAISTANPQPVDLQRRRVYSPKDYYYRRRLDKGWLHLNYSDFLLAPTLEQVRVPHFLCAEMTELDTALGPVQAHRAGFIDPRWGGEKGVQLTCEIRNLSPSSFCLRNEGTIAALVFEPMSSLPESGYGETTASEASNYGGGEIYPKQFIEGVRLPR